MSEPESSPSSSFDKFSEFVDFLCRKVYANAAQKTGLQGVPSADLYQVCVVLSLSSENLAEYVAEFCDLPYLRMIQPDQVDLGTLSASFCRAHTLLPLKNDRGRRILVLANPFNLDLLDLLKSKFKQPDFELAVADPKTIVFLLVDERVDDLGEKQPLLPKAAGVMSSEAEIERFPIVTMASNILHAAVSHRASDIHIEPKDSHMVVRFRVDGDMQEVYALRKETGIKLISRLKIMGGMDIAERRKPQDGSIETEIENKTYKLRVATTSTPKGESIIIRVLDPTLKPRSLEELGMSEAQVKALVSIANRDNGFLLVVGPTGCGKTTTIYSLLARMAYKTKSLISVEDPVEYRIPFANQQQVNEKAGISFEALLKSTLRQDPDILFMGEMRDPFSAKVAFDFASTGHLTISSLHTSNATTAVFRLERLGISREIMADTIAGIVAQRLLKTLCSECKIVGPPRPEEMEWLGRFTDTVLKKVARTNPAGCPHCNHTGYWGREGVYEIIEFGTEFTAKIRANRPISEIRKFMEQRGDYLLSHHAVDKVRQLRCSPKDVYERVLVEEFEAPEAFDNNGDPLKTHPQRKGPAVPSEKCHHSILVVEDDKDTGQLITRLLENRGYDPVVAEDGVDALMHLGKRRFDLILSDINMPNLNGFKLLELITQKEIDTPVLFLTAQAREEDEIKGFRLGAVDYIKKPIQKEVLMMRIERALKEAR